jgi:CopG family transcriptional regulator, nickel-responsive regulator
MELARFGASCSRPLLEDFDRLIAAAGYGNRSEALSALMQEFILREKARGGAEVVGSVVIVYDHHQRELSEELLRLQHRHHGQILSTLHIHLTADDCLEVVIIQGPAAEVQELADRLISTRGVKHGQLVIAAAGAGG